MRGEHVGYQAADLVFQWIIPACAGNTRAYRRWYAWIRDHPRMRGEHLWPRPSRIFWEGSSPHARGTRGHGRLRYHGDGIIPACAGNTDYIADRPYSQRDHPRMRGEHIDTGSPRSMCRGSSPHARGTQTSSNTVVSDIGIIPACAGNTMAVRFHVSSHGDHPRMRGEHQVMTRMSEKERGSSPHARGTPFTGDVGTVRLRIIPACAGNTSAFGMRMMVRWDHPRMRGEHRLRHRRLRYRRGSSPHARGTPEVTAGNSRTNGIIPACAGNTLKYVVRFRLYGDHPRMRGEHLFPRQAQGRSPGSSPHARGTPAPDRSRFRSAGIIPACAGNTLNKSWNGGTIRDHPRMRGEHPPAHRL